VRTGFPGRSRGKGTATGLHLTWVMVDIICRRPSLTGGGNGSRLEFVYLAYMYVGSRMYLFATARNDIEKMYYLI